MRNAYVHACILFMSATLLFLPSTEAGRLLLQTGGYNKRGIGRSPGKPYGGTPYGTPPYGTPYGGTPYGTPYGGTPYVPRSPNPYQQSPGTPNVPCDPKPYQQSPGTPYEPGTPYVPRDPNPPYQQPPCSRACPP